MVNKIKRSYQLCAAAMIAAGCSAEAVHPDATTSDIVGGEVANASTTPPWIVYVVHEGETARFSCTGSLIDAEHVLTAAHCVYRLENNRYNAPVGMQVAVGVTDHSLPVSVDAYREVDDYYVHPDFLIAQSDGTRVTSATADLAILHLASPIRGASPVQLSRSVNDDPEEAEAVDSFGYGRTSTANTVPNTLLRYVQTSRWPEAKVNEFFSRYNADVRRRVGFRSGKALYSSDYQNEDALRGTCFGDSGGPAVRFSVQGDPSTATQVAVHSKGFGECGDPTLPDIGTLVSPHDGWIQMALNSPGRAISATPDGAEQCNVGLSNCDGEPNNGCETNLRTNNNCGACGNVCIGGTRCRAGRCVQNQALMARGNLVDRASGLRGAFVSIPPAASSTIAVSRGAAAVLTLNRGRRVVAECAYKQVARGRNRSLRYAPSRAFRRACTMHRRAAGAGGVTSASWSWERLARTERRAKARIVVKEMR